MKALCLTLKNWNDLKSHFVSAGVFADPFYAIDGRRLILEAINPFEYGKKGYLLKSKFVSMIFGHYGMWEAFRHFPEDELLILEDDAVFKKEWRTIYLQARQYLPPNWDMLYLGHCCAEDKNPKLLGGGLYQVRGLMCTHAYMIHKRALSVLLETQRLIWAPIDIQLVVKSHEQLNVFAIIPRIVEQATTKLTK